MNGKEKKRDQSLADSITIEQSPADPEQPLKPNAEESNDIIFDEEEDLTIRPADEAPAEGEGP